MKCHVKSVYAAIISVAASASVVAEPSPTVTWLLGEPANLLDFGMHRLNNLLAERAERISRRAKIPETEILGVSALYDADRNRILINAFLNAKPNEAYCEPVFAGIRDLAGVGLISSIKSFKQNSQFSYQFGHAGGFVAKGRPEHIYENLDNIMEIEFFMTEGLVDGELRESMTCLGPLVGSGYAVERGSRIRIGGKSAR